jgi:hypothetical protein
MRFTSKAASAIGIVAAVALAASAADARPRPYRGPYKAYGGGSVPSHGPYFVYGANRAPYGWDKDNPRDFQLQGTH